MKTPNAKRITLVAVFALSGLGGCRERSFDFLLVDEKNPEEPVTDGGSLDGLTFEAGVDGPIDITDDGGSPVVPDVRPATDACSARLASDPSNCGSCGNVCSFANALPLCGGSMCARGACLPGFIDLDNMPATGCEYQCTATQGGLETCDGKDNNCNGTTDEGTDLVSDPLNCGTCGLKCTFLNAGATCGERICLLGACQKGFVNANAVAADGCECAQSNGGTEVCDGIDNDCNGKVDDVPGIATSNDPTRCGSCGVNCLALGNASGSCVSGACVIAACAFGHADADGKPENGCELACPGGALGAAEVCDGIDNDCDGKVDAADDGFLGVVNFCQQKGECAGAVPVCAGGGWLCNYNASVEVVARNQIISNETRCDGKDNDCDGCIDETFPQVGLQPAAAGGSCAATSAIACADDKKGLCQGKGTFVCSSEGSGVTCQVTVPGVAPAAELCNGQDDNCDGVVDNAAANDPARVKDAMVAIDGGGLTQTIYVDAYESSRPDAKSDSVGNSTARACSKANVLPWTNVTPVEAAAACAAAGKRLCTEQEWQRACVSSTGSCAWSFNAACATASTTTCSVYERGLGAASASGTATACYVQWGTDARIYDLTGNVREWVQPRSAGQNPLRGGSFDTVLDGSTCSFSFLSLNNDFRYANSGFRCCSNTAP